MKNSRWRVFGGVFMMTVCLLLLGIGFAVVEINTKQMTDGTVSPRVEYQLQDGMLVIDSVYGAELPSFSEQISETVGKGYLAIPTRYRACFWLVQAETSLIDHFFEWITT